MASRSCNSWIVHPNETPETWSAAYAGVKRLARGVTEDDLQDAALEALRREEPVERKRGWLRAVAKNRWRMRARRTEIWNRVRRQVPEDPASQVDAAERSELIQTLERALGELPGAVAEAVRMRFFQELTTAEIAERQGCPHGTARWRVHDGLRRLRRTLDDAHGGREAWLPGLVVLADIPPPPPSAHLLKAALMISTAVVVSALAIATLRREDTPPAPKASAAQTGSSSTAEVTPAAAPRLTNEPSVVNRPSSVSESPTASSTAPTAPLATAGKDDDDGEACGDEAIRAFNAAEGDPHAEEYLLDAATCYEDAGLLGRAFKVYSVMLRVHADGRHVETAKKNSRAIMERIVDPVAGMKTPLAETCMAPVDEAPPESVAVERMAAADCLMGGALVGAAAEQRKLAAPELHGEDKERNAKALAKLEAMLDAYRKKLAALPK